ncbi:hypothetical protein ACPVTF_02740 [Geobacillus icigianus]|uniref:Uncharacterized protein n=1 Tax=Geobacillus subterraneus TaxID=129338 RepID=A0A679FV55_9BACL|nr:MULTISPECIES: hypothetical protein [Geobacillus]KYD24807.1 hypothetical protein B4113_2056 [Geobacillus sp. B4113_201601]BBW98526.1 hypothetical protein GsuE55_33590 [Geobacillus subterraneus]BBW98555.1 hypothetical protein GsuE55_33880 [Geobacillus subterraneus]
MKQNLWDVLQELLEKDVIGATELALAKERLSPQEFSALAAYLQDSSKKEGNLWV